MSRRAILLLTILLANAAVMAFTPGVGAGKALCDTAKGWGDEEVSCPLECDAGDTISAEIRASENIRTAYVEVQCGDGFDNDICNDKDFCDASDTTSIYGAGHCSGWGDEPWSAGRYTIQLWCGASGSPDSDGSRAAFIDGGLAYLANEDNLLQPGDVCASFAAQFGTLAQDDFVYLATFNFYRAPILETESSVVEPSRVAGVLLANGGCHEVAPTYAHAGTTTAVFAT